MDTYCWQLQILSMADYICNPIPNAWSPMATVLKFRWQQKKWWYFLQNKNVLDDIRDVYLEYREK